MGGAFLATFLIGLREGLEATLIVSIVAAFLRRNGHSLRPMFLGVALAVLISLAVGVGLDLVSAALPQRRQEMLETVIGAVAVVFVTTMIIWMNRNAHRLKGELEAEAQAALRSGGSAALVAMAFLAVLKEGFETAVFLLAAVQAAGGSGWSALVGAAVGIGASIVIGTALYRGAVRLDLGRFFRITGVFLVLIAAGLVLTTLRTAHEAGWVVIGQQQVADLSGWMPRTSVLGALVTGLFGIPVDPRLVEVLGWVLYAVPVLLVFLWPASRIPAPERRRPLLLGLAGGLAVVALALVLAVPAGGDDTAVGPTRTLTDEAGRPVTATIGPVAADGTRPLTVESGGRSEVVALQDTGDGRTWETKVSGDPGETAPEVTLGRLAELAGGRLPVGLSAATTPGPFTARWSANTVYDAHTLPTASGGDALVSAASSTTRVVTLSGGGLRSSKTVSVGSLGADWAVPQADADATTAAVQAAGTDRAERMLWRAWLPAVLLVAAAASAALAFRSGRRVHRERKERAPACP
ncbi:iron uptake transporter permease EfeU [Pseudonocardia phyllosphaerae]|uniref:iron uptake transporter permease EfeU n=1 Tax=Pseudonocardia phyllosphaerae TaxID=3390502 RepID=UPI00397ADA7A